MQRQIQVPFRACRQVHDMTNITPPYLTGRIFSHLGCAAQLAGIIVEGGAGVEVHLQLFGVTKVLDGCTLVIVCHAERQAWYQPDVGNWVCLQQVDKVCAWRSGAGCCCCWCWVCGNAAWCSCCCGCVAPVVASEGILAAVG